MGYMYRMHAKYSLGSWGRQHFCPCGSVTQPCTAAMMLPIAHAVLEEIKEENQITSSQSNADTLTSVKYTKTTYNSTHGADGGRNWHNGGDSSDESELVGESDHARNGDWVQKRG